MSFVGLIPARYASTRFPGKPLALIGGKPMVQWVYEQASKSELRQVAVATDDERIRKVVEDFGGRVVMTSPDHRSGTDRCGEAARLLELTHDDIVVNIQGDEPFIRPDEINLLVRCFDDPDTDIATLVKRISPDEDPQNPNMVKVVFSSNNKAIYFSRYAIPFQRENTGNEIIRYKHIGIYAYRYPVLKRIIGLPVSSLEASEKLEQLRWLENGYTISVAECFHENIAVDTPEDLERVLRQLKR